jgi:hypothetical protein
MRILLDTIKPFGANVISQTRKLWRVFLFLYLPIGLLFLIVGTLSRVSDRVTLALFMKDIVLTGDLPFYTGFVPQMEAILWSASLAVCLFTLYVMQRRDGPFTGARRFLLQVSILTGILMLDDIFLFHGEIAPLYLNIAKQAVLTAYFVLGIFVVLSNWREIQSSEYLILISALGLFGVSISLDVLERLARGLPLFLDQLRFFLEDGFKFAGTATWLTYFVRYAAQRLSIPTIAS